MPPWVGNKSYPHRLKLACFRGKNGFGVIGYPYNA